MVHKTNNNSKLIVPNVIKSTAILPINYLITVAHIKPFHNPDKKNYTFNRSIGTCSYLFTRLMIAVQFSTSHTSFATIDVLFMNEHRHNDVLPNIKHEII